MSRIRDLVNSLANVTGNVQNKLTSSESHIIATNNPHNVTADQIGVYTKLEIDNLLEGQGTGSNNTSGLSEQVIDSFPVSGYRSGEYLITCSAISGFMTLKLLVLHDDVETYNTIYGQLGTDLGVFDTSINGSNVEILFTPNVDGVEVKFNKTMI